MGTTRIKGVGDILHIWMKERGSRLWITNVDVLRSYVTKYKVNKEANLEIDMIQVENRPHDCNKAEVVGNKLYLRTKENLECMQNFINDEDQNEIELENFRIIKIQEDEALHLWFPGNGTAFGIRIKDMIRTMKDFERKLKYSDEGYGWMYEPCCFQSNKKEVDVIDGVGKSCNEN